MTLKELCEKKGKAVAAYRELLDRAEKETRSLTAEEQAQLDAWEQEIDEANAEIAKHEAAAKRKEFLERQEQSLRQPVLAGGLQRAGADDRETLGDRRSLLERIQAAVERDGLTARQAIAEFAKNSRQSPELNKALRQLFVTGRIDAALAERAGLQADVDTQGGFLVMPEQFTARVIADLDRTVLMRSLATIIPLGMAESLGVPTRDTDFGDLSWTTELSVGSEDTSLAYGKRRLTPHPCARYIKVSKDLMRLAAISPEAEVRARINYKAGTVQENAFLNGSGSGSPLGVFTASNAGISTGRDVSTGNTTTSITTDGLINAKYSLESQWLTTGGLRWIFHRDAVKQIRKLKDGNGQYLWQPGITMDMTDRILDIPVLMSEYAPSTFTASQYVGILGDFSYYWIVDRMSIEIQRLVELFALTNQDGFVARFSCDGMPILETAFARVKLAAS